VEAGRPLPLLAVTAEAAQPAAGARLPDAALFEQTRKAANAQRARPLEREGALGPRLRLRNLREQAKDPVRQSERPQAIPRRKERRDMGALLGGAEGDARGLRHEGQLLFPAAFHLVEQIPHPQGILRLAAAVIAQSGHVGLPVRLLFRCQSRVLRGRDVVSHRANHPLHGFWQR
jgi:hypothetical protein